MNIKVPVILLMGLLLSSTALGQFTAQLFPAETVLKGNSEIFTNVGIYDHANTIIAGYRYGIGGYTDGAARMGFVDTENGGDGFMLSGDMRYQLMEVRIQDPLDLSAGGLIETILGTGTGNVHIGGFIVGSRPIALTQDKDLWPYGRLVMRWDRVGSHDEFNIGLNLGASYSIGQYSRVSAEFQFDDQFGFILGADFGL